MFVLIKTLCTGWFKTENNETIDLYVVFQDIYFCFEMCFWILWLLLFVTVFHSIINSSAVLCFSSWWLHVRIPQNGMLAYIQTPLLTDNRGCRCLSLAAILMAYCSFNALPGMYSPYSSWPLYVVIPYCVKQYYKVTIIICWKFL